MTEAIRMSFTPDRLETFHIVPDAADFDVPTWRALAHEIYAGQPATTPVGMASWYANWNHRKVWETTQLTKGLLLSGNVHGEALGLGIGVGKEPLTFFLARKVKRLIATDLFGFSWESAPLEMLFTPAKFAPFSYPIDHLTIQQMDGLRILFPDGTFDFVYSISSVEHFGGAAGAMRHIVEARRALKPGGLLGFTTELALAGTAVPDWCFRPETLSQMITHSGMQPIHALVGQFPKALLDQPATLQLPQWALLEGERDRLSMRDGDLIYTSVVLLLRKPS